MKLNKKIVIAIVLVAIVGVVLIAFTLLPPFDEEAGYLLRLNYDVGEKLTYEMNMTIEEESGDFTDEIIYGMEILDFDGKNYTIEQSIGGKEHWASCTTIIKVNQTGHVVEYVWYGEDFLSISGLFVGTPILGINLPSEEIKLGESWEIVIDPEMPELDIEGAEIDYSGTYTLAEVTNETIKLEYEATVIMTFVTANFTGTTNITGTIYLDAVTCGVVESNYFLSLVAEEDGEIIERESTMHCRLVSVSEI